MQALRQGWDAVCVCVFKARSPVPGFKLLQREAKGPCFGTSNTELAFGCLFLSELNNTFENSATRFRWFSAQFGHSHTMSK